MSLKRNARSHVALFVARLGEMCVRMREWETHTRVYRTRWTHLLDSFWSRIYFDFRWRLPVYCMPNYYYSCVQIKSPCTRAHVEIRAILLHAKVCQSNLIIIIIIIVCVIIMISASSAGICQFCQKCILYGRSTACADSTGSSLGIHIHWLTQTLLWKQGLQQRRKHSFCPVACHIYFDERAVGRQPPAPSTTSFVLAFNGVICCVEKTEWLSIQHSAFLAANKCWRAAKLIRSLQIVHLRDHPPATIFS